MVIYSVTMDATDQVFCLIQMKPISLVIKKVTLLRLQRAGSTARIVTDVYRTILCCMGLNTECSLTNRSML